MAMACPLRTRNLPAFVASSCSTPSTPGALFHSVAKEEKKQSVADVVSDRCYWRRLWQHAAAGCILCTSALIATSRYSLTEAIDARALTHTRVYRVYLHYHTVEQVLVGLGIGIASSCLYVLFLDRLGMPYIVQPLLLDSSLGVFLRLRDNKDVRDGHPFLPCRPSG